MLKGEGVIKSKKLLFEKLYYSHFQDRKIIPVHGYYQSIDFDFKNTPLQNKTILDFGCGSGLFSFYLILIAGAKYVVAIDEFEGKGAPILNYRRFTTLLKDLALMERLSLIKADGVSYDFNEQRFDIIYCSYVLHHIFPKIQNENPVPIMKLLKKFKSLLNPGGKIIIREVMRHNITEHFPKRLKPFSVNWKTKRNSIEWIKFFKNTGFRQISTRYYIPFYFHYFPLSVLLGNRIGSYFLTSRYVLECQ